LKQLKLIIISFLIIFSNAGCTFFGDDGGTTGGNPLTVDVNLASYDNSIASMIFKFIIDDAQANITSLNFCFKRIRFKTSSNGSEYNYDFNIGEVAILSTGTTLNAVTIQAGTYTRVEFDLEKNCDGTTKPSVSFVNGNGSFQTNDRMTIKFDGSFTIDQTSLSLFVVNFTNAVKAYNGTSSNIKPTLEALSGSF
jgi:hypothetical protein